MFRRILQCLAWSALTLVFLAHASLAEPSVPKPVVTAVPSPAPQRPTLELGGHLQIQADDGHLGNRTPSDSLPSVDGITRFPAASYLNIRRLRLVLTAHLGQDVDLVVQGHTDTRADESELRDCYVRVDLPHDLELLAGQFKVRFGREGLASSSGTMTIERSDMTRALYQERDLGLNLGGRTASGLTWDFGIFQGQGLNAGDRNPNKDASLRLVLPAARGLEVGVSGQLGTVQPDGSPLDIPVRRWGIDLRYQKGRWTLESEAIWSQGWNKVSRTDSRAFGAYLGNTWTIVRDWDAVLFYDWFDPDLDRVDTRVANNALNARNRVVLGVNYYLDRKAPQRVMLNYEIHRPNEGPRVEPDGWRLRYEVRF
ncbi:MAG: porin [Candidatus Xenobium sp.]|jgi:phosphate-selective porin